MKPGQSPDAPANVNTQPAAAGPRPKPLFALKPDSSQHSRLRSPVVQPVGTGDSSPRSPQENVNLPKVTRKESNALPGSQRTTKLAEPVRAPRSDPSQDSSWAQEPIIPDERVRPSPVGIAPGVRRLSKADMPSQQGPGRETESSEIRRGGSHESSAQSRVLGEGGALQRQSGSGSTDASSLSRRGRPSVLDELSKVTHSKGQSQSFCPVYCF